MEMDKCLHVDCNETASVVINTVDGIVLEHPLFFCMDHFRHFSETINEISEEDE